MGIWEKMPPAFLDALEREFGFDPPREPGLDVVEIGLVGFKVSFVGLLIRTALKFRGQRVGQHFIPLHRKLALNLGLFIELAFFSFLRKKLHADDLIGNGVS